MTLALITKEQNAVNTAADNAGEVCVWKDANCEIRGGGGYEVVYGWRCNHVCWRVAKFGWGAEQEDG